MFANIDYSTLLLLLMIFADNIRGRYIYGPIENTVASSGPPGHKAEGEYHPDSKSMRVVGFRQRNINWNKIAQDDLRKSVNNVPKLGVAKNVILFLGDGMGLSDVTATRFLMAERQKKNVEEIELSFETFSFHGFSKTHTSDRQTPDSAGAATAILSGEKVNFYTVGVKDSVPLYDCTNINEETKLKSLLVHSMEKGKWTGLVTNTRITHATPSAAYAHSADRNGEAVMPKDTISRDKCQDIAYQLVHGEGQHIRVIFGGGRKNMINETLVDIDDVTNGKREDGRNLTEEWLAKKNGIGVNHSYITNKKEFDDLNAEETDYVLGLFNADHMSYEHDRKQANPPKEPSLSEMVRKALQILQRSGDKGYFLFVEGGRIDQAHHRNLAYKALDETIAFADAVEVAKDMTDEDETLIVVTADHSHVFNLAGYPEIHNPVLGTYMSAWEPGDRMPFTPLSYANGPGFNVHNLDENGTVVQRANLTGVDTTGANFVFDAGMPNDDETHGGEDVGIHASGPMAYLFQGVHQQHYIAHALMYASCVGPHTSYCDDPSFTPSTTTTDSSSGNMVLVVFPSCFVMIIIFIGTTLTY